MFERFTDRARRVVILAQEEARFLNCNYIGTEHLLLGLIREGEGVAAKTLEAVGMHLHETRSQVEEIIGQGGDKPSGHIPYTPRAKKVLELSLREALQLGHNYIGTEHILLGLIREGEGVAAQIIKQTLSLDDLRLAIIERLRQLFDDGKYITRTQFNDPSTIDVDVVIGNINHDFKNHREHWTEAPAWPRVTVKALAEEIERLRVKLDQIGFIVNR